MEASHGLEPPLRENVADPGAQQLAETSDSEDQFTDAKSIPSSPERDPASLEVDRENGTALSGEASDSNPETHTAGEDDGEDGGRAAISRHESNATTPRFEKTNPIPSAVAEELGGELPGQHSAEIQESYFSDATPDVIIGPNQEGNDGSGLQAPDTNLLPATTTEEKPALETTTEDVDAEDDGDENLDDDFDDFEEGDGHEADFADFEDGFQQADTQPSVFPPPSPAPRFPQGQLPFPIPDFDGLSPDQVISAIDPCLSSLFAPEELDLAPFPPFLQDSVFLTPRSASLWSQLVAPPPLAPPDWIRSYTRRLFLVSLGVPVDLDEILPASKQKKLVLPSLHAPSSTSPRPSAAAAGKQPGGGGDRASGAATPDDHNRDQVSGGSSSSRRRRGPPPEPELDLVAARHLCQTTDEALGGMTTQELRDHVAKLEAMQGVAQELLEYWRKRTDEKVGDREAFEGVIENLVAHARKVRK